MDFSAQFDDLEKRVAEAKAAARSAAAESRDQLKGRIHQAQDDVEQGVEESKQQASQAAGGARSKWAQMKADAAAQREDVKAKIDRRNRQMDAAAAADEAALAEGEAVDALDYAAWAVASARLDVLDAIDARAYADERAKAAGPR